MDKLHQPIKWTILTGEYPPHAGGVSDYTEAIAQGLVAMGDKVDVWAPVHENIQEITDGIGVHWLPDRFGLKALLILDRALRETEEQTRILVQYVPQAFGMKAMNIPFCVWLYCRGQKWNVTTMFHEVAYPWVGQGKILKHNLLAAVSRSMCCLVVKGSRRLSVSIPGWERLIRAYAGNRAVEWMPVPSNIHRPGDVYRPDLVRRDLLLTSASHLVGHFGTFGIHASHALQEILPAIARLETSITVLLVGQGGTEFADGLIRHHPQLRGRVRATGRTDARVVADYLSACDVLIQPYPDGISSRRSSAMAGLCCGTPIVTTRGKLTESIWDESGAVVLADSPADMVPKVASLLADKDAQSKMRDASLAMYKKFFSLEHTVSALRAS